MHVLHVTPAFEPAWAHGDVPRHVAQLARAQVRRGHRVTVLTTDALAPHERATRGERYMDTVRVVRVPNLSSSSYMWFGCTTPVGMRRAARRLFADAVDVVHLHELVTIENLRVISVVPESIPIVVSLHGRLTSSRVSTTLARLWTRAGGARVRRRIDAYVASTVDEANAVIRSGLPIAPLTEAPVHVVPEGVDLSPFLTAASAMREPTSARSPVLLVPGPVRRVDQLHALVDAVGELRRNGSSVQLVVVGAEASARDAVRERAVALGLLDAAITGYLPPSRLPHLLASADIVALVDRANGVVDIVLGTLAMGKPVIDAAEVLPREAIDAGIALRGDATREEWVRSLCVLLDEPARADAMAAAGRRFTATIDWDAAAHRWDEEYERASTDRFRGASRGHAREDRLDFRVDRR
ncbi:MAG: glycosyltransferase family 4 protein [Vicinamibacterales bacterium]